MPKRAKTPPPGDDEPRYFTINQSYPLNANWEIVDDQISCARWVAEIIGAPNLYALLYKPSARGMVLIEVDRSYADHQALLGEHRWKEILTRPSAEQKDRFSQVFYSTYASYREAQKDGWKRIHVQDRWLKAPDWRQRSRKEFRVPYPGTHWCPTPPEDKTDKPMCRPLPTAVLPPPAVPAPPVVGSSEWLQERSTPNPATSPAALRGAWAPRGRGGAPPGRPPPAAVITPTRSSANANLPSASTTSSAGPAWNGTPLQIKSTRPTSNHATSNPLKRDTGAWGKGSSPFPPMGSVTTPNTSAAASTSTAGAAPRKGAWGAPNPKITSAAPAAPAAPPGISIKVAKTASKGPPPAPADNNNASSASPPPLSNPENSASSASSTSSSTFSWADDVQNEMEQLEISRDTVVIADSTTTTVYGEPDELLGDEGEDEYSLPMAPGALSTSVPLAKASNDLAENLWAHHDEDDNEQGEEFQCSVHFGNTRLCKKGICSERAEYEKQKKRKEREQEREKAREKGQQKQGSKGKGSRGKGNRNLTKDNSRSTSRSAWGSNADQRSRSNSHSRSPAHREASPSAGSTAPVEEADPWF